jgi:hypothetical protein
MQLLNNPIVKYDTISVQFVANTTATKINVPDQPQLRGKKVLCVDFPPISYDFLAQPTLNLNPLFLNTAFLNLYFNGGVFIENLPLRELQQIANAIGSPFVNTNGAFMLSGQKIVWDKCFINLPVPLPSISTNLVILIGVYYTN